MGETEIVSGPGRVVRFSSPSKSIPVKSFAFPGDGGGVMVPATPHARSRPDSVEPVGSDKQCLPFQNHTIELTFIESQGALMV